MNPSSSSAASAAATGDIRTANLEDAQRESVRSAGRTPDFGGGTTEPTYSAPTYSDPAYGEPSYAEPSYEPTYGTSVGSPQPRSEDLMATGAAAGTAGGGSTVLTAPAGPSAKDKASQKAKELTVRGKEAVTKLTADNELVGKATRSAQENALVIRAKELAARKNSGGSHARTVEAPRPAPPERPSRTTSPRSAEQIERDIEKTRSHLAWAVDEVNHRVKPANVIARTKAKAQSQVVEPDGKMRTERVGPAVGAAVGLLLLRAVRSRRRRKKATRRTSQA